MRDPRFIAAHRGGLLGKGDHRALACWAAECAERVLPLFEAVSSDSRPREAIATARRWAEGDATVGEARKASVAAHAAARETKDPAAVAAARAAGHAVATAHMADHSLGGALYAIRAMRCAGVDPEVETGRQIERLPAHLRGMVLDGLETKGAIARGPTR
ncbi:MAG: hypothetical protein H7A49_06140 [Akkermansiaceae bacterium]|nr:hypothetical protein [Akkermansiaceae bacterium]MCP5543469.1 hypothetical protein [Akkermansiaceae bacterium]MCP5546810.1 hypothetical protein [Akkermansiaceae bacterium]